MKFPVNHSQTGSEAAIACSRGRVLRANPDPDLVVLRATLIIDLLSYRPEEQRYPQPLPPSEPSAWWFLASLGFNCKSGIARNDGVPVKLELVKQTFQCSPRDGRKSDEAP